MIDVLSRHKKIGFQFSGGRDSLAALYLLKPYWKMMTVYHLDTGDQFPETIELVNRVSGYLPNFVRVSGMLKDTLENKGWPTDLMPKTSTPLGVLVSGETLKLIDRYSCCWFSLMKPLHERMLNDGVTLIIRGQKNSDYHKPPLHSGFALEGVELFYPIECMHCTAWWDDKRGAYLKEYHPKNWVIYQERLKMIDNVIKPLLSELTREMS